MPSAPSGTLTRNSEHRRGSLKRILWPSESVLAVHTSQGVELWLVGQQSISLRHFSEGERRDLFVVDGQLAEASEDRPGELRRVFDDVLLFSWSRRELQKPNNERWFSHLVAARGSVLLLTGSSKAPPWDQPLPSHWNSGQAPDLGNQQGLLRQTIFFPSSGELAKELRAFDMHHGRELALFPSRGSAAFTINPSCWPIDYAPASRSLLLMSHDGGDSEWDKVWEVYSIWLYHPSQPSEVRLACVSPYLPHASLSRDGSYAFVLAGGRHTTGLILFSSLLQGTETSGPRLVTLPDQAAVAPDDLLSSISDRSRALAIIPGVSAAHFATGSDNLLWVAAGKRLFLLALPECAVLSEIRSDATIDEIALAPGDRRLAFRDANRTITVRDLEQQQTIASLSGYLSGRLTYAVLDTARNAIFARQNVGGPITFQLDYTAPPPLSPRELPGESLYFRHRQWVRNKLDLELRESAARNIGGLDLPASVRLLLRLHDRRPEGEEEGPVLASAEVNSSRVTGDTALLDTLRRNLAQITETHQGPLLHDPQSGQLVASLQYWWHEAEHEEYGGDPLYPDLSLTLFWNSRHQTVHVLSGTIVAFLPGNLLALLDQHYRADKWNAHNICSSPLVVANLAGQVRRRFDLAPLDVTAVALEPSYGLVAVLQGWTLQSQLTMYRLATGEQTCHYGLSANGVSFSTDGRQLLTWTNEKVTVYDIH